MSIELALYLIIPFVTVWGGVILACWDVGKEKGHD